MGFNANTSKASEGITIKPEGDYEVIISEIKRKQTPSGAQSIGFKYTVRNDVAQSYQNACIFHDVWKKKEPNADDIMAEGYNFAQLMAIAGAAGLPANADFERFDAFLNALVGKPVKVHLYHNEYNGKISERVDKHNKTAFPAVNHKQKTAATGSSYAPTPAANYAAPAANPANSDDYPF